MITFKIVLGFVAFNLLFWFFGMSLMAKLGVGFARRYACWMGWHSHPNFDNVHKSPNDPYQFLTYAKCKWCGYEGQIDSQGNLF